MVMWPPGRANAVTKPLIRKNAKQCLSLTCFPTQDCARILVYERAHAFYVQECLQFQEASY